MIFWVCFLAIGHQQERRSHNSASCRAVWCTAGNTTLLFSIIKTFKDLLIYYDILWTVCYEMPIEIKFTFFKPKRQMCEELFMTKNTVNFRYFKHNRWVKIFHHRFQYKMSLRKAMCLSICIFNYLFFSFPSVLDLHDLNVVCNDMWIPLLLFEERCSFPLSFKLVHALGTILVRWDSVTLMIYEWIPHVSTSNIPQRNALFRTFRK